jgi:hypothetical protein
MALTRTLAAWFRTIRLITRRSVAFTGRFARCGAWQLPLSPMAGSCGRHTVARPGEGWHDDIDGYRDDDNGQGKRAQREWQASRHRANQELPQRDKWVDGQPDDQSASVDGRAGGGSRSRRGLNRRGLSLRGSFQLHSWSLPQQREKGN